MVLARRITYLHPHRVTFPLDLQIPYYQIRESSTIAVSCRLRCTVIPQHFAFTSFSTVRLYRTSRTGDHLEMRKEQLVLMFCFFGVWRSPESSFCNYPSNHTACFDDYHADATHDSRGTLLRLDP